jgi:hypothetical protein
MRGLPRFCPRCGVEHELASGRPVETEEEPGTTLNELGELVPDREDLLLGFGDWVPLPGLRDDVWVCPDCATVEERRQWEGVCVRCGAENGEAPDGSEEPEVLWACGGTVCHRCATHTERRALDVDFIRTTAAALSSLSARRPGNPVEALDVAETAVEIGCQRGVPNKLHYLDPLDPVGTDDEPWDLISSDLQAELVRCSTGLCHRRADRSELFGSLSGADLEKTSAMIPPPGWPLVARCAEVLWRYVHEVS